MPGNSDYTCGTCGKHFAAGSQALQNHCNATGHRRYRVYACETCTRTFSTNVACTQHMRDTDNFAHQCHVCDGTYPTEEQVQQHERYTHLFCSECDRFFRSANNLDMHLKSRAHLGQAISCPFCKAAHTTAAGVVHHIERGCCPRAPSVNRDTLFKLVRSKDPSGLISKKLIGWTGADTTYEATGLAWNGYAYECYLCHREFTGLHGLNQHLASPAHQQPYYHCFNTSCRRDFKTLAALLNHLESETCGAMRFDKVQRGVDSLMRNGRLLT